ncbi:amine oxidase, flavin-containing superfamily [Aspergillus coremiiformis]|uniref:Amine oxidase, flavin-containing superfamily n=1 Tax=Aspergillus coremiiformis TaxID=138285 RepID=A0A5N6ZJT3_9EURO|nr:amine oxidase, flavin-containing superfamily [Aspergillus coremiiformis]
MRVTLRAFAPIAALLCLIGTAAYTQPNSKLSLPIPDQGDILERDVVIIGGGSAGTYAAIRLRQLDQSVVVIEKHERLGGHSNTYFDPVTGIPVAYGVMTFHNKSVVTDYFAHFNIPLVNEIFPTNQSENVDFTTGEPIDIKPISIPSDDPEVQTAVENYMAQLAKYPFLEDEYYHLPDPIPEDLLLPFGAFATKYRIDAIVPLIAGYTLGFGDPLAQTTLYMLKTFSRQIILGIQRGTLTYTSHNNNELYQAAEKELGSDVLYQSTVIGAQRGLNETDDSRYILAQTPSGQKFIRAKKILVTIPPTRENLVPFDLDKTEEAIFTQFSGTYYWTSVIRNIYHTGSAPAIQNRAFGTPYNLPILPGVYGMLNTRVPGLNWVLYGSSTFMSNEEVKRNLVDSLLRVRHANVTITEPEIVGFASHSPYEVVVPVEAIKAGFYRNLHALQGHRGTYYTGAALTAHESHLIWGFTEKLLFDHFV